LAAETIPELWEIVSDPYKPPPPGKEERHHGVDFSYYRRGERTSIQGESIQAILPGTVAAIVQDRLPYGNMVILETSYSYFPLDFAQAISLTQGGSLYHLYAHMETTPTVSIGEEVACGQVLGTVGLTGYNIVNPHLHLETRRGPSGVIFEGMVFYDTSAMPEEMENYKRWRTGGEFQHFDPMVLFDRYLQFLKTDDPP
jgi:murein DD-endopeptidase MepM/ murein hydrolase activator NlpD